MSANRNKLELTRGLTEGKGVDCENRHTLGLKPLQCSEWAKSKPFRRNGGAAGGKDFFQQVMLEPGNIDLMAFIGGRHARPAP